MKRVTFPGDQTPTSSRPQVTAVGRALKRINGRMLQPIFAPPGGRHIARAPTKAPAYNPKQRAHTGSCAAARWNDRSGCWWQITEPKA